MKKLFIGIFALALGAWATGCSESDDSTTSPTPAADPIVGTWTSEGTGYVAPGLAAAPFKVKKIVATFNTNGSYTVISTDSSNANVTYKGTYVSTENSGTTIRNIVLTQTEPTTVTSTGIYQVDKNQFKYEVIQTTPAITGITAPTAAEGFGSTKYNGIKLGATWTQTFVVYGNLTGTWVSEGAGSVAPGLAAAPFKVKKIVATFNSNLSYTVVSTDSSNANVTYKGTYVATENAGSTIKTIVLTQTEPTSVTSTGIFEAKGNSLTYEVIQTTPAITGISAPVYTEGFGSTKYNGFKLGITWVQKFILQ